MLRNDFTSCRFGKYNKDQAIVTFTHFFIKSPQQAQPNGLLSSTAGKP